MARKKTPDVLAEVLGQKEVAPKATKAKTKVTAKAKTSAPVEKPEEIEEELRGLDIVHQNVLWAMGAGLLPIPILDVITLSALQLRMLSLLAERYEVRFSANVGKSLMVALSSGIGTDVLTRGSLGSLVKAIPLVGPLAGLLTMPLLSGASTYAVGKVFAQHFESGGTFLDFEVDLFRETFSVQYRKGIAVANRMRARFLNRE